MTRIPRLLLWLLLLLDSSTTRMWTKNSHHSRDSSTTTTTSTPILVPTVQALSVLRSPSPSSPRSAVRIAAAATSSSASAVSLEQRLEQLLGATPGPLSPSQPKPRSAVSEVAVAQEGAATVVPGLPIYAVLETIAQSLVTKPNLLLQASAGAGKTTLVPLQLLSTMLLRQRRPHPKEEEPPMQTTTTTPQQIVVVAPRRVAVRSAAARMAQLLDEPVGHTVGYIMKDEVRIASSKNKTKILVVTDGILLQMLQRDPYLSTVQTVILDEFHERGVLSDTCFTLVRDLQHTCRSSTEEERLHIVVMSATLFDTPPPQRCPPTTTTTPDTRTSTTATTNSTLLHLLGGDADCTVIDSPGRQYPIDILWSNQIMSTRTAGRRLIIPPLPRLLRDRKLLIETLVAVIDTVALPRAPARGDILVFVPGVAECHGVVRLLQTKTNCIVLPLYGALSKDEQDRVVFPRSETDPTPNQKPPQQRIIVATPIAEASLTIPSVTCVVDGGLRREPRCDADSGMARLRTTYISQAAALQRAGRAGRVQPGLAIRLYREQDYTTQFRPQTLPEIASTDLAPLLLLLANWGVSTTSEILNDMPFIDPPDERLLEKAKHLLYDIGALEKRIIKAGTTDHDSNGSDAASRNSRFLLTDRGRRMSTMPCHPRLACNVDRQNYPTTTSGGADPKQQSLLAGAILGGFFLDDDTLLSQFDNHPDLVRTIQSFLQQPPAYVMKKLVRFAHRVAGTEGQAVIELLVSSKTSNSEFVTETFTNLGEALLPGFIDLVAEWKGEASYGSSSYFLANGPKYLLAVRTSNTDNISRIRSYVTLSKDLLDGIATETDLVYTVPSKGYAVRSKRVRSIGHIELDAVPLRNGSLSFEQIAQALFDAISTMGGIRMAITKFVPAKEQAQIEQLVSRITLDKELTNRNDSGDRDHDNEDGWHRCFEILADSSLPIDEDDEKIVRDLIEPWLGSVKSLKEVRMYDIMYATLTPERQRYLKESYPTSVNAPDGSTIPIRYVRNVGFDVADPPSTNTRDTNSSTTTSSSGPVRTITCRPMAIAKLQQFFGTRDTVRVGPRHSPTTVPVTLSLLSPAGQPLAETSDLPFFWKEVYPLIRSEMRGRYPKHPWPEDPLVEVATRQTKKQLLLVANKNADSTSSKNTTGGDAQENKKLSRKNKRNKRKR